MDCSLPSSSVQETEAPMIALRSTLKQPKINAQKDPGEKGQTCYQCGKGGHLKQDYSRASNPPPAPRAVCKGPQWRRDCPQSPRPPGPRLTRQSGLKSPDNQDWRCSGNPTQAPILITPEEPRVLIIGGPISKLPFGHWVNLLCLLKPLVHCLPDQLPRWDSLGKPNTIISVIL